MTPDFNARSFDRARERVAPHSLTGHWLGGVDTTVDLESVTLIVAVKAHCDGCVAFLNAEPHDFGIPVLVISADEDGAPEWRDARTPIFISPLALRDLDVRSPPVYVLIDAAARRVVSEGVLFAAAQVAAEIAPFLGA